MSTPTRTGRTTPDTVELYYETFGSPTDPAMLLVAGLAMQSTGFGEEFVDALVARGLYVIRFDNRDSGLSGDSVVETPGPRGEHYRLAHFADDAVGVLDTLGIDRAHVLGVSMGGMIAQWIAIRHPERVRCLFSVMSSTGERDYGQATAEAITALTRRLPAERDAAIASSVAASRVWASPEYFDEARLGQLAGAAFDRAFRPEGVARQYAAIMADGASRAEELRTITAPTMVIHGTADTLIDQSGGRRTAELIPGAQLEIIEGMGHDLPPALVPRLVGLIADFIAAGGEPQP